MFTNKDAHIVYAYRVEAMRRAANAQAARAAIADRPTPMRQALGRQLIRMGEALQR